VIYVEILCDVTRKSENMTSYSTKSIVFLKKSQCRALLFRQHLCIHLINLKTERSSPAVKLRFAIKYCHMSFEWEKGTKTRLTAPIIVLNI
jgi:hypothetical protein